MARVEDELRKEDLVTPLVDLCSWYIMLDPSLDHIHSWDWTIAYKQTTHDGGVASSRRIPSLGEGAGTSGIDAGKSFFSNTWGERPTKDVRSGILFGESGTLTQSFGPFRVAPGKARNQGERLRDAGETTGRSFAARRRRRDANGGSASWHE